MALEMVKLIEKSPNHIPVDEWGAVDTETGIIKYPIDENDRMFRSVRGEIALPITNLFCNGNQEMSSINYFVMNTKKKKAYASQDMREQICKYLNYFEKFYDDDKELLMVLYHIKISIDYLQKYSINNFVDDINRYIIRNIKLTNKIRRFVDDNYLMHLKSNNKTPNLQFEDKHAKILYEISLIMKMYIPLLTHYIYIHGIRQSEDIKNIIRTLFDLCNSKYLDERGVDIYSKIYEMATNVTSKSKNTDKPLWEKNLIRGNNPTTHIKESVNDIIINIIPKYTYDKNIINFNYYSNRQLLNYKITDISYEYQFTKLSSSKRDDEQNSEYDRYEALLNKKDESIMLQNRVAAEQATRKIKTIYGPFSDDEVNHYKKKLTKNNNPVVNALQKQLLGYLYYKDFGDPITMNAIKNQEDYIKLLIAAKRILLNSGMVILPYIISSKVLRTASRKMINKKDMIRIENNPLYQQIKYKYKNEKIEAKIQEFIGTIISSSYEIIDWDNETNSPSMYDGQQVPMISEIITEELIIFISNI